MFVEVERKAQKVLETFPTRIKLSLTLEIGKLKNFPNVKLDLKKLGKSTYRLRVGEYRAIFTVIKEKDIIVVVEINTRGKISYAKG
ncbi:MAG: type II toxin-antitoxin system RelE/ParE family toxin [Candidatus Micrarchaeota archaeon]|nr:type II toxin-antitoxin system RelE/ParE family toxin [Candidatus Micrarchaeota archaeon]